jgi:hypothetical protein
MLCHCAGVRESHPQAYNGGMKVVGFPVKDTYMVAPALHDVLPSNDGPGSDCRPGACSTTRLTRASWLLRRLRVRCRCVFRTMRSRYCFRSSIPRVETCARTYAPWGAGPDQAKCGGSAAHSSSAARAALELAHRIDLGSAVFMPREKVEAAAAEP